MSIAAIEVTVRSWANVQRRGPAVGIPCTEEQWERFCYQSFCDLWDILGDEISCSLFDPTTDPAPPPTIQ